MQRFTIALLTSLLTFIVGTTCSTISRTYLFPTWKGVEKLCGNSRIENPLCNYSSDLHEVPTVDLITLLKNPEQYDRKIVRVRGRFFSYVDDPFKSFLAEPTYTVKEEEGIGAGYWDWNISKKLCEFIDLNAPESNQADVVLIIQFIDCRKCSNSPFKQVMTILHVEQMSAIPFEHSTPFEIPPLPKRQHASGHCFWSDGNQY